MRDIDAPHRICVMLHAAGYEEYEQRNMLLPTIAHGFAARCVQYHW